MKMNSTTRTYVDFSALYPAPVVRGARVTRTGNRYLGPVAIDGETASTMGRGQIGWFIGGVPTYDRMIDDIRRINSTHSGGRWIVVPATRYWADHTYRQWFDNQFVDETASVWNDDLVTFAVPESLREVGDAIKDKREQVAGIILLDPGCVVHRGRGFNRGDSRIAHDRPQLIVDFRARLAIGDWTPPLMILSRHLPAEVATETISRVYCLEALQFIEGASLSCGVYAA